MLPVIVLMHSPLVGPRTWAPVAGVLRSRGFAVRVPSLVDITAGDPPYWLRVVDAVHDCVSGDDVVLVAHSNAGLFVPAIVSRRPRNVRAVVFADASLPPREGPAPLAPERMLSHLSRLADANDVLPRWNDWFDAQEVAALFPDAETRHAVIAEQPRLPLSYFRELVPVTSGWDSIHCSYAQFSDGYDQSAEYAGSRGWPVERLPGQHLHQLVDPGSVAEAIIRLCMPGAYSSQTS